MVDKPRLISILGSTGSIGSNTIDLIARTPEHYIISALACKQNARLLAQQAKKLQAVFVAIEDKNAWPVLRNALAGTGIEAAAGTEAVLEAAKRPAEWTMCSIVGAAGLAPTLEAVRRGHTVALANKEALVCAGSLFIREAMRTGCQILPVDSEHNAIFQLFDSRKREGIEKITLTASGGPFRTLSRKEMACKTPSQAAAHPNWSMGTKVSIDSATIMNKGLEIIEAHYLFAIPEVQIDVLIHPESVVHSMVSYIDGSVIAQLSSPDMRTPIAYCLAWPKRMDTIIKNLDLVSIGQLSFFALDNNRFPAISLAREALRAKGDAACVMNAANEVAVEAFVAGRIGFTEISSVVYETMQRCPTEDIDNLESVFRSNAKGRRIADDIISDFTGVSIADRRRYLLLPNFSMKSVAVMHNKKI
ncbi:1-deoxy-D-xylulose-5-phosphate reductoisomerase [Candidatus Endolissoclinum faulkneri]|uniref:1-deoxy-D-xylulose-5-phosphate reductoisomerase n=1 Tax=Candidatus Endolissoclinum faulkneri TaxID=1263979 RepID=UPI001D03B257|nr:1-deoxy-D-xylulose-5-phosphate reductoisomerase [Candidatus Endolissoclinum faulkneri]